ncbi:MAG: arylsulfatase [Verrucomicrobiae bacterium]|nr:arylsulfatase [Verrucomicrobiae bacterium]MCP5541701.1 arylsulfatase [Akkermansiaceae bacterium]MCP5551690.1 arylsulfatase [Akkermansiaceae bacterium]
MKNQPLLPFLTLLSVLAAPLARAEAPRPNILLIMSDDMGISDLGCYGGEIRTPNLDSLAADGLRFTQFYNTSRCCPTRACLMTGLYPHQAGIGHMMEDKGLEGYQGDLNRHCVTIAEVMKSAGYGTYMTGKWHVTKVTKPKDGNDKANWPLQRGYERFYGTIHGAGSFFDPNTLTRDNTYVSPFADPEYTPADGEPYYYTNAIADHAARFAREHREQSPERPFFMYVAFTAAHWPMHALEKDLARYRGKYDAGYETIRAARHAKMKALGLIDGSAELSPLGAAWADVKNKPYEARCMEVYAAMIDCMDRGVGRIVATLKETGQLDNTLIFFLQDNGGCAEGMGRGGEFTPRADGPTLPPLAGDYLQPDMIPRQTRDGYPVRQGEGVLPGGPDTYHGYGKTWATVSNTPFREYKHWVHEGGISTPLIVHWPAGIARKNELERTPSHLIDIMATCVDVAGATYPETYHDGQAIRPMEGKSLVPAFAGEPVERDAIFWEHEGNRAVRAGDWKLVAKGAHSKWELYDLPRDRSEMHDLAAEKPDVVAALSEKWDTWAARAFVKPWPWDSDDAEGGKSAKIAKKKTKFRLAQGDELRSGSPDTGGRAFSVEARITKPGKGVVLAQGGVNHGWALYFDAENGRPAVALRRGGKLETLRAKDDAAIPDSPFQLSMTLAADGRVTVKLGDALAIDAPSAGLLPQTPLDPLCAGFDSNDAAGNYPRSFDFTGEIESVTLKLAP